MIFQRSPVRLWPIVLFTDRLLHLLPHGSTRSPGPVCLRRLSQRVDRHARAPGRARSGADRTWARRAAPLPATMRRTVSSSTPRWRAWSAASTPRPARA